MAGINQVIMLGLSMVVIAGMVGAGGLGGEVVNEAIGRIDIGLGFEAGLAVVDPRHVPGPDDRGPRQPAPLAAAALAGPPPRPPATRPPRHEPTASRRAPAADAERRRRAGD